MRTMTYVLIAGLVATAAASWAQAQEAKPEKGGLRKACSADVEKFCAGIAREKGGIRKCLNAHASEVGDACKAQLASRPKT